MSATKRINTGDYTIDTFKYNGNPLGNVLVTTHTLRVYGNLEVTGTNVFIDAFDTINPIIRVNANLTTADAPRAGYSGLENNRGNVANVGIYWDEDGSYAGKWVANNSVGDLGPILTSYETIIQHTTDTPTGIPGFVVITGEAAAGGGTGLYVNAGASTSELVSTQTAKKYAIIFG
jgi:hypothetical protein